MGLIDQDVFVCLDCESTGLDPEQDRLIEYAAQRFTFSRTLEQKDWTIFMTYKKGIFAWA